jgi:hypothetical protein
VATVFEGRSWRLWAIVNGNTFLTLAVMGAIVGYLK